MTDIAKLFDSDSPESSSELLTSGSPVQEEISSAPAVPRCALRENNTEAWGMRQGREVIEENADRILTGHDYINLQTLKIGDDLEATVSDFFGCCFQYDPSLEPECQDEQRRAYIETLLTNPEAQGIRGATTMRVDMSRLACYVFIREYAEFLEKQEKQRKKEEKAKDGGDEEKPSKKGKKAGKGKPGDQPSDEEGDEGTGNKPGNKPSEKPKDKPGEGYPSPEQAQKELKERAARVASVQRAVKKAQQDLEQYQDACEFFGLSGSGDNKMSLEKSGLVFQAIRNNASLRKILELAGRFRLASLQLQRQKTTHGADETVGITLGGNLARLLTSERAKIMDDDDFISLEALDRLLNKRCLQREMQGIQPKKQGPVFVLLDESGSMMSPILGTEQISRIDMAKGLVLTIAQMAERQKRWVGLVAFADAEHQRSIVLKPGDWERMDLIEWLANFLSGGTSLPLNLLPRLWQQMGAPEGQTDIICLTDGILEVAPEDEANFLAWKKDRKARMITMGIGTGVEPMQKISDEIHKIETFSCTEKGVQSVLSI